MPGDPLKPDLSRLVLPRRPQAAAATPPTPPRFEDDAPAPTDDGQVDYQRWDGFDEDAPRSPDATPLPDVHLLWPLPPDPTPASVEPAVPVVTAPCPGCGAELTVAVKSWCLRCGYDSDQPQRQVVREERGVRQAVVVLLFAAAGCLAIVAATVFRRDVVPDRTDLRIWWIGYEGLAGFLLYWVGHAVAVALTIKHWPDPQPSCFDPLAVWRYALYHLPKTRWAITYGLWGATAFACAFVLFWMNDFSIKDKTAKQKIHGGRVVPAETETGPSGGAPAPTAQVGQRQDGGGRPAESREDDAAVSDAPRLRLRSNKGTAVVIGYVPDPTDPNRVSRVLLGTRNEDGTIRFAGYAQLDLSVKDSEALGKLRALSRPTAAPGYPLGRDVIPVEPKLLADIRYAEMERGLFKDTVITGVAAEKGGK